MNVSRMQRIAYDTAEEHGFHNDSFAEHIALIHSELSEALEAYRNGKDEEIPHELADVAIRLFHCAESFGVDLEVAIVQKMAINAKRPFKHGGKRL